MSIVKDVDLEAMPSSILSIMMMMMIELLFIIHGIFSPNYVVSANTVNCFKSSFDKFIACRNK